MWLLFLVKLKVIKDEFQKPVSLTKTWRYLSGSYQLDSVKRTDCCILYDYIINDAYFIHNYGFVYLLKAWHNESYVTQKIGRYTVISGPLDAPPDRTLPCFMAFKKSKNIPLAAAAEKTRGKNTAAKLSGEKTCDEVFGIFRYDSNGRHFYVAQIAIVFDTSSCFK